MQDSIIEVADYLNQSQRVLFITGAGISAESGLPTYRGIGGLYNNGGATEDDIPIEVALSGEMMRVRPEITWKYLLQIERSCRGAGHNLAHRLIAEIERLKPSVWVLTQNIDGFHAAAGSKNLIEIHGRVGELLCTECDYKVDADRFAPLNAVPHCPRCSAVVRPDVVLFGEMLPERAVRDLQREIMRGFDMVFSIGTTSVFPYISEPIHLARRWGAKSVEINPADTEVSTFVDYKLSMGALPALQAIWQAMGYEMLEGA